VAQKDLEAKIIEAKEKRGHNVLAMDVAPDVLWKYVVAIQDAAAGAKFQEIIRVMRKAQE
jgi:hypothetical protein